MPLFNELSAMLKKGDTLILTVSKESDTTLRVNVTPRLFTMDGEKGEDRKTLNQPISIVGTIEELDSDGFTAEINRFATSTVALRSTIDEVEAAHKTAADTKRSKAKPADDDDDKDKPAKKVGNNPLKDRLLNKPKTAEPVSATLI